MQLDKNISLEMVCFVNQKETNEKENIFKTYEEAFVNVKKNNRKLSDIEFGYILLDNNGMIPESVECFYDTIDGAIKAYLQILGGMKNEKKHIKNVRINGFGVSHGA